MRRCIALIVVGAGSLLASAASADVILSNLPGASSGTGTNLGLGTDGADRTKAVGLSISDNLPPDYRPFESIVVMVSNLSTPDSTLSGGIYSSVGGNPGELLASFTPVAVPTGTHSELVTLTLPGSFTLSGGTSYWFLLDGPAVTNSLLWDSLSPNVAPTVASGITFDGYRFSSDGGGSWGSSSVYNGVTINAVIPAPAALSLLGAAGLLGARRRR
jgi:hypothetical protein